MIKTGIFGGSFNPIHKGHIMLAKHLLTTLCLNEVWFLVSPLNPLKAQNTLLPDLIRYRWVERALENEPQLVACDAEMHLPKPSYMWNTLTTLQANYPDREFVLMIGADNWACFHQWFQAENIIKHFQIAVYPREGYVFHQTQMPVNVRLVDAPLYPISSTLIRKNIAQNISVSSFLPSNIASEVVETYKKQPLIR